MIDQTPLLPARISPTPARPTTAKRPSTKAPKPTPPPPPPGAPPPPKTPPVPRAAHPHSASASSRRSDRCTEQKSKDKPQKRGKEKEEYDEPKQGSGKGPSRRSGPTRLRRWCRSSWKRSQRNFLVFSNDLCDPVGNQKDSAVVIVLPQEWHRLAAKPAHFAVRQNRLEAVAHLSAILAVIRRDKNQDATRRLLRSHAPRRRKINRKLLDRLSFERRNRDNSDLGLGLLIDFRTQCRQLFFRLSVEHTGEIVHVSLRFEILDLLCCDTRRGKGQNQESENPLNGRREEAKFSGHPASSFVEASS